jgi:hypothetical protein
MSVGGAQFETSDSLENVSQFYRSRYPNSTISYPNPESQSIVVRSDKGIITIALRNSAGKTQISISRVGSTAPQ